MDTRICVDMEIEKFEYCNPLHKPVMSLLHYRGTYLSFIKYSDGLLDRCWTAASYQFRKHVFEITTLIHYDNTLMMYQGLINIEYKSYYAHIAGWYQPVLRLQIASEKTDLLLYKDSRTNIFHVNIRMQRERTNQCKFQPFAVRQTLTIQQHSKTWHRSLRLRRGRLESGLCEPY